MEVFEFFREGQNVADLKRDLIIQANWHQDFTEDYDKIRGTLGSLTPDLLLSAYFGVKPGELKRRLTVTADSLVRGVCSPYDILDNDRMPSLTQYKDQVNAALVSGAEADEINRFLSSYTKDQLEDYIQKLTAAMTDLSVYAGRFTSTHNSDDRAGRDSFGYSNFYQIRIQFNDHQAIAPKYPGSTDNILQSTRCYASTSFLGIWKFNS